MFSTNQQQKKIHRYQIKNLKPLNLLVTIVGSKKDLTARSSFKNQSPCKEKHFLILLFSQDLIFLAKHCNKCISAYYAVIIINIKLFT